MRFLTILTFLTIHLSGSTQDSTIYEWYDTEANYPGGESEMMKFLMKNFEYPDSIDNCLSTIYIEFIIEKDGAISNIKAVKKNCPQLEKAAIDVISKMPDWIPATIDNKAVRSKFILPVHIRPE